MHTSYMLSEDYARVSRTCGDGFVQGVAGRPLTECSRSPRSGNNQGNLKTFIYKSDPKRDMKYSYTYFNR